MSKEDKKEVKRLKDAKHDKVRSRRTYYIEKSGFLYVNISSV